MIAVDASVWRLALQKRRASAAEPQPVQFLRAMLAFGREIVIPGPSFQELLSAARNLEEAERLEATLEAFAVLEATRSDLADAGRLSIVARRAGVPATPAHCLTAAIVIARPARIHTVDPVLLALANHCDLQVLPPSG